MKFDRYLLSWLVSLMLFGLSACGAGGSVDDGGAQMARLTVHIPASGQRSTRLAQREGVPEEVTSIIIEVVDSNQRLLDSAEIIGNEGTIELSVPAGSGYTVRGRALAGSELLFRGEASVAQIGVGANLQVSLTLEDQVVLVLPTVADIAIGTAGQTITIEVEGLQDAAVNWYVNGVLNGDASVGSIDANGVYTPPAVLPADSEITITVEPVRAPSFAASLVFNLLANVPPVANAGSDQTVAAAALVTLDGSASSDSDGSISSYAWTRVSGSAVTLSGADTSSATFTAPSLQYGGSTTFRLEVTDNHGVSASDEVTINFSGTDQALVADAGVNQVVTEGDMVTLDGSASSDPDNVISAYLWTELSSGGIVVSDASAATPTFTAPEVSASTDFQFSLQVTNDHGDSAQDTVTITVNNAAVVGSSDAYFGASASGGSYNLWASDGTAAGTHEVAAVAVENGQFSTFQTVGGKFYFRADDGSNGRELWRTDGTAAGTEMLPVAADSDYVQFGAASHADPNNFIVLGDRLLFGAVTSNDGTFNYADFLSLDTTLASVTLTDFVEVFNDRPSGGFGPHNRELGILGGYVYFAHAVYTPSLDYRLYRTDGVNTAQLVANGFSALSFTEFTELNGELFFVVGQNQLWKTDGTTTTLLKTFSGHVGYSTNGGLSEFYNGGMIVHNNALYFVADDGDGSELWVSNGISGSTPDTRLLSDLDADPSASSYPFEFRVVNGQLLFFSAEGGAATDGLWTTDGTAAGTQRLSALSVGSSDSGFYEAGYSTAIPTVVDIGGSELLFFMASDGVNGNELWVSDGSAVGTTMVMDINSGGSSFPSLFKAGNGVLLFSAQDSDGRAKWWRSNGTEAGTSIVLDICPGCFGQSAFFSAGG